MIKVDDIVTIRCGNALGRYNLPSHKIKVRVIKINGDVNFLATSIDYNSKLDYAYCFNEIIDENAEKEKVIFS